MKRKGLSKRRKRKLGIRPGLYRDEDLAQCSVGARLLFVGLWLLCDTRGLLRIDVEWIGNELPGLRGEPILCWINELISAGLASTESTGGIELLVMDVERAKPLLRGPADRRIENCKRRARVKSAPWCDYTKQQWDEVREYFGGRCAYCLSEPPAVVIEHMTPLCRGGNHSTENIVPACAECNSRKASKTPLEFLAWTYRKGAAGVQN